MKKSSALLIAVSLGASVPLTNTMTYAASLPKVVPVSVPDVVAGHTIPIGYKVGESIMYPSLGGYSILANPHIAWTNASKLAYVHNQQALKDLQAFSASPYSRAPETQQAGPINSAQIQEALSPTPNLALWGFKQYTFDDWQYFAVNGDSQGGFLSDSSVLTISKNVIGGYANPAGYLGWRPVTSVMDLQGTPVTVQLNIAWNFSGVTLGLSYPFPTVAKSNSGGSWYSGNQATWDYSWFPTQQPIYANPAVYDLFGTSETMMGTINVREPDGGITGTSGTHTISWGIMGFQGNG